MKVLTAIFLFYFLLGCTTKTVKIIDLNGGPIEGALVLSEQHPYIFTPWIVSITSTDNTGKAYSADRTFASVFKNGYHPIVEGTDLTGALYPRTNIPKGGSVHPLLNDLYYPNFFGRSPLEGNITLYPIVSPGSIQYSIKAEDYSINSKLKINLETKECPGVEVEYYPPDILFLVKSDTSELFESSRFFFSGSQSDIPVKTISGKLFVSFYCINRGTEIYKIGWAVNHMKSYYGEGKHTLIKISSRLVSMNQYIEPKVQPIHSIFLDTPFIFDQGPDLVTNIDRDDIVDVIHKNIPARSKDESAYKEKWINVYKSIQR